MCATVTLGLMYFRLDLLPVGGQATDFSGVPFALWSDAGILSVLLLLQVVTAAPVARIQCMLSLGLTLGGAVADLVELWLYSLALSIADLG